MIRLAKENDLNTIMKIIKGTIEEMGSYGNTQWNENYPNSTHFLRDIKKGDLYVYEEDGAVLGMVCVNQIEPKEYQEIQWSQTQPALVIHRMAVDVAQRKKGIGTAMMKFVDVKAAEWSMDYLKTDTYSINDKMMGLFEKCGFQLRGHMRFLGKEKLFCCYDKTLK